MALCRVFKQMYSTFESYYILFGVSNICYNKTVEGRIICKSGQVMKSKFDRVYSV